MRSESPTLLAICRLSSSTWLLRMLSGPSPFRARRTKQIFRRDLQNLGIGDKCVARFGVAPEHEGINAVQLAELETEVRIDELDISLAQLLAKLAQPLPGDDIKIAGLLKVRYEEILNNLAQIVISLVARLVLEADDGDGVFELGGENAHPSQGGSARRLPRR